VLQRVRDRLGRREPGRDGDLVVDVDVDNDTGLGSDGSGQLGQGRGQPTAGEHPVRVTGRYPDQCLLRRLPGRAGRGDVRVQASLCAGQRLVEGGQAVGQRPARAGQHVTGELLPHYPLGLHQPAPRLGEVDRLPGRLRCAHHPPDREPAQSQHGGAQPRIL
jgi:hypothetical protein